MKLMICTPVDGHPDSAQVYLKYHREQMRIARDPQITFLDSYAFMPKDNIRARSRGARMLLDSDCDYILFWDRDNAPHDAAMHIKMMLQTAAQGHELLGCTYPKKEIDFEKVAEYAASHPGATAKQLESAGQTWVVSTKGTTSTNGVAEVEGLGFGFILVSRRCVEDMAGAYGADPALHGMYTPTFVDKGSPTVALFMMHAMPDGRLLSEDYSFCERWRRLGGKVSMLCLPVDHIGSHVYGGHAQGLIGGA
jgi:hypothetical protein